MKCLVLSWRPESCQFSPKIICFELHISFLICLYAAPLFLQCFDLEEYYHDSDFDPVCGVPCSWNLPFCSFGETSFEKQSRFSISTTSKGHQKLFLFVENFGPFLRMTGQTRASGQVQCDLLLQCFKTKNLEKEVKQIVTRSVTFADVLVALERQCPSYETDLSIWAEIQNLAALPNNPKPAMILELLADVDHWVGRLTPGSYGSDELLFQLVAKLPREVWDECRATAERKARALTYEDLCVLPPRMLPS